jgi:hypothetical protein
MMTFLKRLPDRPEQRMDDQGGSQTLSLAAKLDIRKPYLEEH